MNRSELSSILLGTTDPDRLRAWYIAAFAPGHEGGDPISFGHTALIFDPRSDVDSKNPEPGRFILNFHVEDAHAAAAHLDSLGVTWLVRVEDRPPIGKFGTVVDPDGNYVQIIELSPEYGGSQSKGEL